MEEAYNTQVLPNGVRIVTEHVPSVRSASLGIWVGTGSRSEKPGEGGAAHFIEHMVFKGTERRTARQLAQEMDAIGGQVNAYTTKECTCFYARSLDEHLSRAMDMLCDMVFCSRFDEQDVQTERGVILEEIGMYRDNPEDLCSERLMGAVYKGTPLARPILGKRASLEKMTGAWLREYMRAHYLPGDIVVSLAGSFPELVVEELKARFLALEGGKSPAPRPAGYTPAFTLKKKSIEQNHLTLAFPGLPYGHKKRFVLQLLSSMLGGGMSSRLFQEVRERRGLCYSVYTYGAGHAETGVFAIYTALGKETEAQALETICRTIRDFAEHGPTAEELDRARELSKANVLMGLESTQSRMSALGRGTLLQDRPLTTDEVIEAYNAVTAEDVRALARELFDFSRVSLSAVGRVGDEDYYRGLIEG
ncbi:M16 family metallopeptidase [Intestinimonas butyriciproducens]|uniref:Putative Zn-dependent peptidase n=1 Tax=Intestinimonas butyriciproducens TaxID=1297617 RepID=A0A2U1CGK1_9FIRM|nr:pitrilysin family protein [Intestinimonas butyriciproducens]MCI7659884.1 insulinase family protein [Flintibacter sp.]SCJ44469.1 Protease 3 precursor [uncultured Clostridium sp.]MBO3282212.1 insulinase family protein [Intestinimonas butyriciproducens]MCI6362970.1 insulinase family protein [Intestinimonas butyriciproducens]MCR1904519.1 insulinase family protein [Intestinimonas butyriciproducens]